MQACVFFIFLFIAAKMLLPFNGEKTWGFEEIFMPINMDLLRQNWQSTRCLKEMTALTCRKKLFLLAVVERANVVFLVTWTFDRNQWKFCSISITISVSMSETLYNRHNWSTFYSKHSTIHIVGCLRAGYFFVGCEAGKEKNDHSGDHQKEKAHPLQFHWKSKRIWCCSCQQEVLPSNDPPYQYHCSAMSIKRLKIYFQSVWSNQGKTMSQRLIVQPKFDLFGSQFQRRIGYSLS